MKTLLLIWLSALAVAVPVSSTQPALWRGEGGSAHFESDAPLEFISATSYELRGFVDQEKNTFAFSIPTSSFRGFNNPLQQEHFHENYMESALYPRATFSGKFIESIQELGQGNHEIRAKGMLNIHGHAVERILKCQLSLAEAEMTIVSEFMVPLIDHHITVPQVVHQKIAEEIYVKVNIKLSPI